MTLRVVIWNCAAIRTCLRRLGLRQPSKEERWQATAILLPELGTYFYLFSLCGLACLPLSGFSVLSF